MSTFCIQYESEIILLTLSLQATLIDTGATDQYIVNDGEDNLATDPISIFIFHATVGENGRLVHLNASIMLGARNGQLVGVEKIPA